MLNGHTTGAQLGRPTVIATTNRGISPEEYADLALAKILHIGDDLNPLIKDQVYAFKDRLRAVLVEYFRRAIDSSKTTMLAELNRQGHQDVASILRQMKGY